MRLAKDIYTGPIKEIIEHCMIEKGNNPNNCFNCDKKLTNKNREIHHLKYDGATIDDLRFGCHSCNMRAEFTNLK